MKFISPSAWEDHIPRVSKNQLPFLITEKSRQLLMSKHLGMNTVGHGILPRPSAAGQFAKRLLQFALRQMEVPGRKQERLG